MTLMELELKVISWADNKQPDSPIDSSLQIDSIIFYLIVLIASIKPRFIHTHILRLLTVVVLSKVDLL